MDGLRRLGVSWAARASLARIKACGSACARVPHAQAHMPGCGHLLVVRPATKAAPGLPLHAGCAQRLRMLALHSRYAQRLCTLATEAGLVAIRHVDADVAMRAPGHQAKTMQGLLPTCCTISPIQNEYVVDAKPTLCALSWHARRWQVLGCQTSKPWHPGAPSKGCWLRRAGRTL